MAGAHCRVSGRRTTVVSGIVQAREHGIRSRPRGSNGWHVSGIRRHDGAPSVMVNVVDSDMVNVMDSAKNTT
jgi:hypothetical protein